MAWQKGKPRPDGAGRKKGTPNKKTQDLMEICDQEGVDVFRAMVLALKRLIDSPMSMPGDIIEKGERIAQYLYPKRKALEHSGKLHMTLEDLLAGSNSDESKDD